MLRGAQLARGCCPRCRLGCVGRDAPEPSWVPTDAVPTESGGNGVTQHSSVPLEPLAPARASWGGRGLCAQENVVAPRLYQPLPTRLPRYDGKFLSHYENSFSCVKHQEQNPASVLPANPAARDGKPPGGVYPSCCFTLMSGVEVPSPCFAGSFDLHFLPSFSFSVTPPGEPACP